MGLENTFVQGLYYSNEEIKEATKKNLLLNLDLDLSNICNLMCTYCDKTHISERHCKKDKELNLEESLNIIDQAKELGCKNIQIIGAGEPTLDPKFWKLLKYATKKDILVVLYTNGTRITKEFAKKLFNLKTSVVLKYNSFNEEIQDTLVGVKGYHKKTTEALKNLVEAGFSKEVPTRLAIDCIATPLNYKDVFEIFKYCRKNNISPQISSLIPHGEALERNLVLPKDKYEKIYKKAYEYDKKKGLYYKYQLPFLGGFQCRQVKYGLYVDIEGNVWECNAGELKLGNIRQKPLKEMWLSKDAKRFRKSWKCGNCHIREKYWRK